MRLRSWTAARVAAVQGLRAENSMWGMRKFRPLLRPAGHAVSDSTASGGMAAYPATAASAARFLDKFVAEAPFPVRAVQIDGGSEFKAEFEAACEAKRIAL